MALKENFKGTSTQKIFCIYNLITFKLHLLKILIILAIKFEFSIFKTLPRRTAYKHRWCKHQLMMTTKKFWLHRSTLISLNEPKPTESSTNSTYNLNFSFHKGLSVFGLTDVLLMYLAGIKSLAVLSRFFLKLWKQKRERKVKKWRSWIQQNHKVSKHKRSGVFLDFFFHKAKLNSEVSLRKCLS